MVFSEDNLSEINLNDSFLHQFKHIISLSLVKKYTKKTCGNKINNGQKHTLINETFKVWYIPSH